MVEAKILYTHDTLKTKWWRYAAFPALIVAGMTSLAFNLIFEKLGIFMVMINFVKIEFSIFFPSFSSEKRKIRNRFL